MIIVYVYVLNIYPIKIMQDNWLLFTFTCWIYIQLKLCKITDYIVYVYVLNIYPIIILCLNPALVYREL